MAADAGRTQLAPGYSISRVINGCWQLSPDHGGGPASRAEALGRFAERVALGFTTFDCADIYAGTESLLGEFRRSLPDPGAIQVHTKFVPDKTALHELTAADVDAAIERSRQQLGVDALDLVQLHWWDYEVPGIELALERLAAAQSAGRLKHIGLTNFDTAHLESVLSTGIPIVSLQTQYSLIDRRPQRRLAEFAVTSGVNLLAYGALAGGFLSEHWLNADEPRAMNRSLTKYRLIIDEAGGWTRYQALLRVLAGVADKHDASIALVALAWVLERPGVAAAIAGIGSKSRTGEFEKLETLALDEEDHASIARRLGTLEIPPGDAYELERDPNGLHAGIIRTDLRAGGNA